MKQSILDTLNPAPVYTFIVPSTGKKVKFRPYTVAEEQALLMVKESDDVELILTNVKNLIKNCTFGEIDPEAMAYFDIEYFFMKLRAKSVGEEIRLSLFCKTDDCKGEIPVLFNIDDLAPPAPVKDSNIVKLNDSLVLVMKYPGFETLQMLMTDRDKDGIIRIIANLIDTVANGDTVYNGSDFTQEEKTRFIKNMNSKTLQKIINFIDSCPTVNHKVKRTCKECGQEHEYTFGGLKHFFG